ncbi:hypothetical protein SAMN04488134_105130 [Amphibacillus marinus]|uniref:Uncharacterized protein n=1 Tax=Amphibacillus marinus TaxID=872970 RepID=A0A1H8N585_9BACI|nr:hypothetical protein [Amphibacillus marinus]SEO24795.1 hypothetical protein SAMN04488134_105130 [Amphibacillus marinus]
MKFVLPLMETALHQQLDVLLKRYYLKDKLYHQMNKQFRREQAGFKGEQQLDYHLSLAKLADAYSLARVRL